MHWIQQRARARQDIIEQYRLGERNREKLLLRLDAQLVDQLLNCKDEAAGRILLGISHMKRTPLKAKTPLETKTRLQRKTRLRPVSPKRAARSGKPGKLGIVRLTGKDLTRLRTQAFKRDLGICQACQARIFYEARFAGDLLAYDMAHIQSRGAGGSDTLENVRCLCHQCHMREHGC